MNKYAPVFDSHCDTLARSQAEEKFVTGSENNHIDLPRLMESGVRDQIMAICCEPYTGREEELWNRGISNFRKFQVTEKPRLHFGIEGCLAIFNGWELPFHPLVASLTWNGDNPYAGGIGSSMNLTDAGRELAAVFIGQNTAVDVSHLNDISRKSLLKMGFPVCATHCNARKLCTGMNRNLPDQDLKEIAARGGVIGVTFVPDFLEDDGEKATIESIVNHAEYIAEKTSMNAVGFGSDFDGVESLPAGIAGAESWHRILDALETRGWSSEDVTKVAGGNWRRFFNLEN